MRRRVAAIDYQHTANGFARPGTAAAVSAALGRPGGEPGPPDAAAVEAALRVLPSHGWTQGMFGRRDRCLLVLSQLAGVPYQHLATLTARDVTMVDGTVTITSAAGSRTVVPDPDPVVCGPCAVARWLRVLDVLMTTPSTRELAAALRKSHEVTDRSPHLCRSTRGISAPTAAAPLLPPIDQWGYVPFPVHRLTPHSLSQRVQDMLAGDFVPHRRLPDDNETPEPEPPPAPAPSRAVYSRDDAQRAWVRRRADLRDIAGIDDVLAEIDARAKELERRSAAVLAEHSRAVIEGGPQP
jgi:hypothetical protein